MKAMILSAGYGTRLGDLTREIPKGMLEVGGYPILAWIVANLVRCGIDELAMNLHFQPEVIQSYFGDGSRFGVRLRYSFEECLLGTAGGTRKLADFFQDADFMVHYGDILTDEDLGAMYRFHQERDALVTMMLHERAKSNSVAVLDEDQRITSFLERPGDEARKGLSSRWVNSGICVCSPEVLDHIPVDCPADFPRDVFTTLIPGGRVFGYPLSGYRCAIDSPARLASARSAVAERRLVVDPALIDGAKHV